MNAIPKSGLTGNRIRLLAEQSTNIRCSVEAAYSYTCNLENFGQWFPGVLAIESANFLDPSIPGKEYLETVSVPLRGNKTVRIIVKETQSNELLITEGNLWPLLPRMEMEFRSIDADSCQVSWRMLSRSTSLLVRVTVIPLAAVIMGKRALIGMAKLKANLEAAREA